MTVDSALQSLLGARDAEAFLRSEWQQFPLHARTDPGLSLLTEQDVQQYLLSGRAEADDVRLLRCGIDVSRSDYCFTRDGRPVVHPGRTNRLFREGSSIVLHALHHRFDALAEFTSALSRELGHVVAVNGYYSPPRSTTFAAHHDTHDVFVLQVCGAKQWCVYEPAVQLPVPHQPGTRLDVSRATVHTRLTLEAGDVLYLPRGWIHRAATSSRRSLHLTLGVHVYTWYDDIRALAAQLAEEEVTMRHAAGSTPTEEVIALLASRLDGAHVRRRAEQRLAATLPVQAPVWLETEQVDAIGPHTMIQLRPDLHATLHSMGTLVELRTPEVRVRVSDRHRALLAWLLSQRQPREVRAMPGTDITDSTRVAVARTLAQEGLLIV